MEGMVTAWVEGESVWWPIRQQQEEFCDLVQNGKIGPNHDGLYWAQKAPDLNEGVKKATPVLGSVETHDWWRDDDWLTGVLIIKRVMQM